MLDATAEANALLDAEERQIARDQRWAARIDAMVGAIPVGGNAMAAINAINGITGAEAQVSIGNGLVDWVVDEDGNIDEARRDAVAVLAEQEVAHLDMLARATYQTGELGTPEEIRRSDAVRGANFFDAEGNILPISGRDEMSESQYAAYMRWLGSADVFGQSDERRDEQADRQARDRESFLDPFGHGDSIGMVLD